MKNNQILPFERNRYYSGKMLTSSDFIKEQLYNNNKRRFINRMMYGSGIVCGLSVYNLDDLSLMVDSGVAIDAAGREIVVENTVIKKLSAVSGFDELETDTASLCIKYEEEEVHGVYAPSAEGREYEFNHIDEIFELYLVDADKTDMGYGVESEFLLKGILVNTQDYTMELSVPAVVCMGKSVKILITLTKHTEEPAEFYYRGVLQMPMFSTMDGMHETEVVVSSNNLKQGESIYKEIWVRVQNFPSEEAKIIIKPGSVKAVINEIELPSDDNLVLTVVSADINPRELVDRELGKTNLEMRNMSGHADFVKLADISFERTESGCVIKEIEEKRAKHYIEMPSDGAVRNKYLEYYAMYMPEEKIAKSAVVVENKTEYRKDPDIRCSGGYFEIPLGKGAKKGQVYFTGEILHTLGTGHVYVEVGYENVQEDVSLGREVNTLVYGSPGIFMEKGLNKPSVEAAVKVIEDKGSFIAGIKFLKDYRGMVFRGKWAAVKISEDKGRGEENGIGREAYITTEKTTIIIKPKETCFIPVKFVNMDAERLYYELTQAGSGEISDEGIYTAPDKEGVFEIHIYSTVNPLISTYVYVVVKQDGG